MAQLSDDCFAFGGELMRADTALGLLAARVTVAAGREDVALTQCRGRILADDIVAGRDVPPHDNVAVDGYAVRFVDLDTRGETHLRIAGRVAAGHTDDHVTAAGEAIRVFTGARLPHGADTVFMQEDCRVEAGTVIVPPGLKRGANSRKAGEDIKSGSTILSRGARLRPQDIGLAASVGLTRLPVYQRLKVAVLSTGDELREPGESTPPGTVFDANRYTLLALLDGLGCTATDYGILKDRRAVIEAALRDAAASHDAIVTSGGMSTGEEDHVRAAVETLGSIHFWRLAIRPGRPVALGHVGAAPFVGLPGNPVAMMVTFLRFARPVLLRLGGATLTEPAFFRVRAGFEMTKKHGRREWVRARLTAAEDGGWVATKFPRDGAGILTSLVAADGLVEVAEDVTHLAFGAMVDFLPFNEVLQ